MEKWQVVAVLIALNVSFIKEEENIEKAFEEICNWYPLKDYRFNYNSILNELMNLIIV